MKQRPTFFHSFKNSTEEIILPEEFTYPFNYIPHPICKLAAKELQDYVQTQTEWEHNFGLDPNDKGPVNGKMFGVMLVQNQEKELGFLAAYSGKLADNNGWSYFVPPVYDRLANDGFFKPEEKEITKINHQIQQLLDSDQYKVLKNDLESAKKEAEKEIAESKKAAKVNKIERDKTREIKKEKLSAVQFEKLEKQLSNKSFNEHAKLKKLNKKWRTTIEHKQKLVTQFEEKINTLKKERKKRSIALQHKLFEQYSFLDAEGNTKSLFDIFNQELGEDPPSGAGECAAPKLFQYAYSNNLKPIAMAEFWWGQSTTKEVRKHGYYYPSCRSKCKPILGHMMKGLTIEPHPNDFKNFKEKHLEVLYNDNELVVIVKPNDLLSVRGKEIIECVKSKVERMYPEASGPMMVHRLDMATSGIMVVAKTEQAYLHLQKQFIDRKIDKRYVALLEEILQKDQGVIELPLRVDLDDRPRQLVCYEHGRPAKTEWKILERREKTTLVEFHPITGRTHQLRVHAAHSQGLNAPIVGDELYGQKTTERLYLHAEYIKFQHPINNKEMEFEVKANF